ncbi:sorbitol dehydrogenase [Delitschia confertaspora ATCC 74209]|uniref:D-xylulose reductase n=1 Tax=Delitschia confertaspora ATCC 74209 TaxID=1513339 RepID=A0A9P4MU33_9PLEO|nr:sorbitol dehydrogenase [Delitschia confertaspora ATCC 74209]
MQNPSWFLYGPGSAKLQDVPIPTIKHEHDVIVRIKYVGVCGSDVHFWRHGGIGLKVNPSQPLILGHEASGVISSIGSAVQSVKVGDKVAIEPGFPCRRCKACKNGTYNLCSTMKFAAAPPDTHGCLTKYFVAPEDFVYKIPDEMDLEEAVLVEPTAVAVHAVRLAKVGYGESVVVFGSGTVGLLCGAVARALGASRVIMVDILRKKLEFAKTFVECETFLPNIEATAEHNANHILDIFGISEGVDAVIEASGAELSAQTGIFALKTGGNYVQTGIGKSKIEIPILALSEKELRVRGCFRYGAGDYDMALKLIREGHVTPNSLVSSITPLEHATIAWEKTARGEGIKNLIEVGDD